MLEEILYQGDLFQVVRRKERHIVPLDKGNSYVDIDYEIIKRPPGVRAIIVHDGKLLLNKEYRYELKNWDYRIPGGKVFDSLEEYQKCDELKNLTTHIEKALVREVFEEVNINVYSYQLFACSNNGFTVEWDLYYYIVDEFELIEFDNSKIKRRNEYEYTQSCWVDYTTVLQYCMENKISEDRSVGVIMKFLLCELTKRKDGNNLHGKY